MSSKQNIFLSAFIFMAFSATVSIAQKRRFLKDPHFIITPSTPVILQKELLVFNDNVTDAVYRITIAADVPNNKKPMQVIYQMEAGHIFLILQKIMGTDTIHKVFGFYPVGSMPIIFKNVKSQVKDNSRREHDVELSRIITKEQFETAIEIALQYSKKKYHMNKFNCYDYAVMVYNAVAGSDTLPVIHIKYPLFFGKGGSPCSLYKYMKLQKEAATSLSSYIQFGNLVAPASTQQRNTARK